MTKEIQLFPLTCFGTDNDLKEPVDVSIGLTEDGKRCIGCVHLKRWDFLIDYITGKSRKPDYYQLLLCSPRILNIKDQPIGPQVIGNIESVRKYLKECNLPSLCMHVYPQQG